jgi:multidrug efflux pump subunit AcrA (membrane-fusion protein)
VKLCSFKAWSKFKSRTWRILLTLSVGFGIVYWLSVPQDLSSTKVSDEPEPIAQVETIKLHKGEIKETLNAYGVVLPLPDKLTTLSVPYISKVDKMQVNQGQIV